MNRPKRQFYLTNKDLLREIHKSKMSYCWTKTDEFSHFDIIVEDIKDLKKRTVLAEAKQNRATRLQKQAHEAEVIRWEQGLTGKNKIDPKITHKIWKNMIYAYIDFERRNFNKKK